MKTLSPMQIYKPIGLKVRRFTEYRLRGLIKPEGEVVKLEATKFNPFQALRAALIHLGESQGLTLEAAAKIPELALTPLNLLQMAIPVAGIHGGDVYLISVNGEPVAANAAGDAKLMRELFDLNLPQTPQDRTTFALFGNEGLSIPKAVLAAYRPGQDNLSFFNLSAWIRRVVVLFKLDPAVDIFEPLGFPLALWENLAALPEEPRNQCVALMQTAMMQVIPWVALKDYVAKQGLDVKLLNGVFGKGE